MNPQNIGWEATPIPRKVTGGGGVWGQLVPAKLRQEMRRNPGVEYQLLDLKRGRPLEITQADVAALQRTAPRPYRVQTRSAQPGVKGSAKHVWVSNDPGHWKRLEEAREQKQ